MCDGSHRERRHGCKLPGHVRRRRSPLRGCLPAPHGCDRCRQSPGCFGSQPTLEERLRGCRPPAARWQATIASSRFPVRSPRCDRCRYSLGCFGSQPILGERLRGVDFQGPLLSSDSFFEVFPPAPLGCDRHTQLPGCLGSWPIVGEKLGGYRLPGPVGKQRLASSILSARSPRMRSL